MPAIARALVHGKQSHATQTVKLLLECGANSNYTGIRDARTCFLHLAVRFELPTAMLALLEAGAETEDWKYIKTNPGPCCTPLLQACTLTNSEPLRMLLRYGAAPNPHTKILDCVLPSPALVVIRSCIKRQGEQQVCIHKYQNRESKLLDSYILVKKLQISIIFL